MKIGTPLQVSQIPYVLFYAALARNFFQIFNVVLGMENLDQFTLYLHQHKDILPECTEPYGQFNIKINGPTRNGTLQDRWFVIKDFRTNGLPRPELPCQKVDENETLGYEGGIGKCLYGE